MCQLSRVNEMHEFLILFVECEVGENVAQKIKTCLIDKSPCLLHILWYLADVLRVSQ